MSTLNQQFIRDVRQWYFSYAESYLTSDEDCRFHILLKRNHSFRTAGLATVIAKRLDLPQKDVHLATLIGLLHDVARFGQYTRFRTFNDLLSFDHGTRGADLIVDLPFWDDIGTREREILLSAVTYHNKAELPEDLTESRLLHTRLIRDADKLDILYLTCGEIRKGKGSQRISEVPINGDISHTVLSLLKNKKPSNYNHISNECEFLLLKIGWVYNFNFRPSLEILQKSNHLSILQSALPSTKELNSIFADIASYLDEKVSR